MLSAAMIMHVAHGARKVCSRGATRQALEHSAAMDRSMDAQAQISGMKRSAWVPMLPTPGNVSEECNTTIENMLETFVDDLVECLPQNCSSPPDRREIDR